MLQITGTVVPGSNPAFLTVENSEDRQGHRLTVYTAKIAGKRGKPPPEAKQEEEEEKNKGHNS